MCAVTWRSTTYVEVDSSPSGSLTRASSRVQRIIDVLDPANPESRSATVGQEVLRQAALDFVGYSERKVTGGTPWISRVTPAAHPLLPRLYCTGVQEFKGMALRGAEGFPAAGSDVAIYNRWRLTLEYSTLPFKILSDEELLLVAPYGAGFPDESSGLRSTSRSGEYGGKFVTIPRAMMQTWPPGNDRAKPVMEGTPLWETEDSVVLTWYDVPETAVPWTALRLAVGTLNNAAFTFRGVTYPTNTLLFLNVRLIPEMDITGQHTLTLQYNFRYAPHVSRDPTVVPAVPRGQNWLQIGRASCRERVQDGGVDVSV